MNKQEAIRELMSKSREIIFGDDENVYLSRKRTIELVSQIDEPEKVVVPKFVAEWIEEGKRSGWHLQKALYRLYDDKVGDWAFDENDDLISEKVDIFARAWLDGYEIEQEKLYTVEIPNPNSAGGKLVLFKQQSSGRLILDILNHNINKPKYLHLTESEIKKDFDFLWQFAKETENDTKM